MDMIAGFIRALIGMLGGYALQKGYVSSDTIATIQGLVLTLGAAFLSVKDKTFTKDKFEGVLRALLSAAFGFFQGNGWLSESQAQLFTGYVGIVGTMIWSAWSKWMPEADDNA